MDKIVASEREQLAIELLSVTPLLNRIIAYELNKSEQDETTIVQLRVLSHLVEESITMSDLAKRRRVSLQASSEHVQGLVERGWVERIADKNDRRRFLLHITEAGRLQFEDARHQLIMSLIPTLEGLTVDKSKQIQHALISLRQVLLHHPID